jgi:hypothetical protein
MAIPIKFSPEVQAHIDAGHFSIDSKRWPSGSIWLAKRPDGTVIDAKATRAEVEAAAVKWYDEQAAKINR